MDTVTVCAANPARGIYEVHIDSPDRHVTEIPLGQSIPIITWSSANTTARVIAKIRFNSNKKSGILLFNGFDAKSLQLECLADKLFDKHGFLLQIEMVVGASITT
jgi:hypothetical protein